MIWCLDEAEPGRTEGKTEVMAGAVSHLDREVLRDLPALRVAGAAEASDGPHDLLGVGLVAAQEHKLRANPHTGTHCGDGPHDLLGVGLVVAQEHKLRAETHTGAHRSDGPRGHLRG